MNHLSPARQSYLNRHVKAAALQVDIFSLGVIMYELFTMAPLAFLISLNGSEGEPLAYAQSVAIGHREGLPKAWPTSVKVCANNMPRRHLVLLACLTVLVSCPRGRCHLKAFAVTTAL
jgi:hypothetical protein